MQSMIVTILCIPALAFMREEPPSPPSVVANDTNNDISFWEGLKELISNRNYISIFMVYLFLGGINNSLGAIYSNLASKFEYSILSISIGCLLSILGGVFFSFVVGIMLDKYQCYKKIQMYICAAAVLVTIYHTFSLPNGNPILEWLAMFLNGSTALTVSAVSFPFAVEVTFPV
jgi:hypothetical protein